MSKEWKKPEDLDGDRLYKCRECLSTFLYHRSLMRHIGENHRDGSRKWNCKTCDYSSTRRGNYERHMDGHRKDEQRTVSRRESSKEREPVGRGGEGVKSPDRRCPETKRDDRDQPQENNTVIISVHPTPVPSIDSSRDARGKPLAMLKRAASQDEVVSSSSSASSSSEEAESGGEGATGNARTDRPVFKKARVEKRITTTFTIEGRVVRTRKTKEFFDRFILV